MLKRAKEYNLTGKKVISLDIGQHTTKFIAGQKEENSIGLTHAVSFPTPLNAYENGRIIDFDELGDTIRSKLKELKINASLALCSVESSEIITREISVPSSSDDEIEKMLDYEIKQHMPIDLDEYMILSKLLDNEYDNAPSKVNALVTAIPNSIVNNYYDLLKSMKLKPAVFDTQSNVLDKLIGSGDFFINEDHSLKKISFAVIEIGYGHINVSIFKNGKYIFSRLLNQGAQNIDRNLMRSLDISQELAEKFKFAIKDLTRYYQHINDRPDLVDEISIEMKVLNNVRNTIDDWLEKIEKIMHFYTMQSITNNIEQIYIFGGTTRINGFDRYVQHAYNIPVSRINNMTNVTCNHFEGDEELASYINALGTLIRR